MRVHQKVFDFAQQISGGHNGQRDGQSPICQWAIAHGTKAAGVGILPLMTSTWRVKLRDAIAARGTSMKRLSLDAGLGSTFVRDILERDRDPSHENATKLAKTLGVPYSSIFGATNDDERVPMVGIDRDAKNLAQIPVYDIRLAAGAGAQIDEESPIDFYPISMAMLRSLTDAPLAELAIFQVDGDSMEPTIQNRAWVMVDCRRTKLTNPGIYALVHDGEGLLKRASQHLQTGVVTLVSDNPLYPPQTIKSPHRLKIIGRVFLAISRH
jgi:phage repressor protein C with HTH and peptisase S24 domain